MCRQLGVSEATFYIWKKKCAHLGVSELRQLWAFEDENAPLTRLGKRPYFARLYIFRNLFAATA